MIPTQIRQDVIRRDRFRCAFCAISRKEQREKTEQGRDLHVHHIWPRKHGGDNSKRNLLTLCPSCHKEIEATARRIVKRCDSDEAAKEKLRRKTINRIRSDHPLSTPLKVAELRRKESLFV